MLVGKSLSRNFGVAPNHFQALRDVNVDIKMGENLAIIGKSGSGKSTLMHILAALDRPSSGELWVDGKNTKDMNNAALAMLRNQTYSFIFQQFYLMPRLNVLENVAMQLKIRGIDTQQRTALAMQALERVGLAEKAKSRATDLSGGQKQRVAVARAIVAKPKVLFADEPTGNLDSKTGEQVIDLMFQLNKREGVTVVVVTHDRDFASMCDRQIEIVDGRILRDSKQPTRQAVA